MADTITSSSQLKTTMLFYDSDDRTITTDDPKPDLTATQVMAAVNYMKEHQALIGDKAGASLVGAKSAEIVEKTVTKYDLS